MLFPWVKRCDLISFPHDSGGWVVKDPLTLHYTLLDDLEFQILSLLNGSIGTSALLRQVQKMAPDKGLTMEDLAEFVGVLAGHQLVRSNVGGDARRLSSIRQPSVALRLLAPLLQVLSMHLPLLNPTKFLDALLPFVAVLFTRTAARIFISVCVAAVALVTLRFSSVIESLPTVHEFLGPQNMALILLVFVVVKAMHEAGHAFCGAVLRCRVQ